MAKPRVIPRAFNSSDLYSDCMCPTVSPSGVIVSDAINMFITPLLGRKRASSISKKT